MTLTGPAQAGRAGAGPEPVDPPGFRDRAGGLARRHGLFLTLIAAGAVLRLLAQLAYQPAILYYDSFRYLLNIDRLSPAELNPIGYELFVLRPLLGVGNLQLVTAVQHLAGLGMAVAVYVLLQRHGARRWVAALAAGPLLLDAYQVQIEQNIMTETFFQALLLGVIWLLTSRGAPGPGRSAAAGILIAVMVVVRLVAVPLVVPAVVYLVLAGGAWRRRSDHGLVLRRTGALLAGFAVVVAAYGGYFWADTGRVGISDTDGSALYGRTATVADCDRLPLTEAQRQLCPAERLGERLGVDHYVHDLASPAHTAVPEPEGTIADLQRAFARTVLLHQPFDVAGAVLADFGKGFAWTRSTSPDDVPVDRWHFHTVPVLYASPELASAVALRFGGTELSVDPDLAWVLRAYQFHGGHTPGPLLAAALVLGLAGAAGLGRARRSGLRAACLLTAGAGITVLLTSAAFEFSWRYQLPGLVLLPLTGALGLTALLSGGPSPRRPLLGPFPDEVDAAALAAFRERYGEVVLGPVVVVMAAYQEADNLPAVLDGIPDRCGELRVDTLVVVDGGTDGTATVALAHEGAYTCVTPVNRGQGAALRLGYRIAQEHGARYVVTTDADGQYDIAELPTLLAPLVSGEADFVTGSRRLGREDTTDRFRQLGVRVFAALATVLARQRITDTSFGFRAMTIDVACSVPLRQPQYQASELLLGAILRGHRVVERPMTMRDRTTGRSKKGPNLLYGTRYGRVLVGTWWRERRALRSGAAERLPVR
ncbi:glycosyltransferase family 2 protein [Pseudonocardia nigra]|uniref:glycosyltransferase family 2 protein n=1 Tax=Pseudonocardia nigra TaxID=1921578 RepID=UPI0027E332CA|nr:glycosyltransferase family 2 protein [Pseudonocardia nigra]